MEIPEDVIKLIRSVVLSVPDGIPLYNFLLTYKKLVKEPLNLEKLGYKNVQDLLNNLPNVVKIKHVDDEFKVFGLISKSMAYINPTAACSQQFALQDDFPAVTHTKHNKNSENSATIHIGNLPKFTTKEDLYHHFNSYKIHRLRILDNDKRSFAFFDCEYPTAIEITNNEYLKKFKNQKVFIELSTQCKKFQNILFQTPTKVNNNEFASEFSKSQYDTKLKNQNNQETPFSEPNCKEIGNVKILNSGSSTSSRVRRLSEEEEEIFPVQEKDFHKNIKHISPIPQNNITRNIYKNNIDDPEVYRKVGIETNYNLGKHSFNEKHIENNAMILSKSIMNSALSTRLSEDDEEIFPASKYILKENDLQPFVKQIFSTKINDITPDRKDSIEDTDIYNKVSIGNDFNNIDKLSFHEQNMESNTKLKSNLDLSIVFKRSPSLENLQDKSSYLINDIHKNSKETYSINRDIFNSREDLF